MHTHSLTTALTLYRSGTLTLAQAASRAGKSQAEFRKVLAAHGIALHDAAPSSSESVTPARAD
ncbi:MULTISPECIES: DUF7317 family protein [Haloprofundus]|uniref:DUF7317 family protein n=1 Tax=Haloprofundus TaxID=1911573 RepID=UPI000E43231C|nr:MULTISPECIES: UPF0175 family protein [Haloprofundus]QCJ46901.1 hypothetical protein FCF25_07155 [Haloprofundus sp. MHR1]